MRPQTVEAECGLWRPHAAAAVRGMLSLAAAAEGTAGAAGEEVRRLAVEFVMTMLEAEPDMVQVGTRKGSRMGVRARGGGD